MHICSLTVLCLCFQETEGTGIPMPSSIGDDGEQVPYPRANVVKTSNALF